MHSGDGFVTPQRGFTYIGLLLLVAMVGATLGVAASSWALQGQRAMEREQIWRGRAIATALGRFHAGPVAVPKAPARPPPAASAAAVAPPASAAAIDGEWPRRLEDLVEDRRGLNTVRHLRRLYADPCTGKPDWALERNDLGGIVALRSRCDRPALLREGLEPDAETPRLSDRRFGGVLPTAPQGQALSP